MCGRSLPRFRGESSERTWLYRIAHNIAISALESRRRRDPRELSLPDSVERMASGTIPTARWLSRSSGRPCWPRFRNLPPVDKQLIVLHLEGLSYQEIEEVSGLSESAVASRLSRIRDRLTEMIRRKEVRQMTPHQTNCGNSGSLISTRPMNQRELLRQLEQRSREFRSCRFAARPSRRSRPACSSR